MPKVQFAKLAQFVTRNPYTTAAAIFAPMFASNEDRGYFRTSLITTPIVFAAGEFAPRLFSGVRDTLRYASGVAQDTGNFLQKQERWTRWNTTTFSETRQLFRQKEVPQNIRDRALSAMLVSERRSRNFDAEMKSLDRYFKNRFYAPTELIGKSLAGDERAMNVMREINALHESKGRLLVNAMSEARRASMTPEEWLSQPSGIPEDVPSTRLNEWIGQEYSKWLNPARPESSRLEYVKTLKNRLRGIKDLNYAGTIAGDFNLTPPSGVDKLLLDFNDISSNAASRALYSQDPATFENLKRAYERGTIGPVTLDMQLSDDVTKGVTGRVLSARVTRTGNFKGEALNIPVVDRATGSVRLAGGAKGVGKWVIGPDGNPYTISEWTSKMLAEQSHLTTKQLSEEIAGFSYWIAGDPRDAHRMAELEMMGEQGQGIYNEMATKIRSYAADITGLPLFGGQRVFDLKPEEKMGIYSKIMNSDRYIAMGSENRLREFGFQLKEAAFLNPLATPGALKQDPFWRALTKEIQLEVPEARRFGMTSDAWSKMFGFSELPAAEAELALLGPDVRSIFGNLPAQASEMIPELALRMSNRGYSPEVIEKMTNYMSGVYNAGGESAFKFLNMGETTFVPTAKFAEGLQLGMTSSYNVDELGVKVGDQVRLDRVLGFNRSVPVTPTYGGEVVDVFQNDMGGWKVNVRGHLPPSGAKWDVAGVKGMGSSGIMSEEQQGFLTEAINRFYELTGTGDRISPTASMFAPAEYVAEKMTPDMYYLAQGRNVMRRLEAEANPLLRSVAQSYQSEMKSLGLSVTADKIAINTSGWSTANEAMAERINRISSITENMFARAGEAIRAAGGASDPVLNAYVHGGKNFGDYMRMNSLSAVVTAWDHARANVPAFMTLSGDVNTYLEAEGKIGMIGAIQSRVNTRSGGDVQQAIEFAKRVMTGKGGDLSDVVVDINDAFPGGRQSLTTPGGRAGSIFDPSLPQYQKNFMVKVGDRTIPVPGTGAYGAEANLFGTAKSASGAGYASYQWQHIIQDMAGETNPERLAELEKQLTESFKSHFVYGKGSVVRPYQVDPVSVPGFLAAGPESEPFRVGLSPESISRLRNKRLRASLAEGGEVLGFLNRQPTNATPYVRFYRDSSLAGAQFSVSERLSRYLSGDLDKDLANAVLIDANVRMQNNKMIIASAANASERAAAEEAIEYLQSGRQEKMMGIWEKIYGVEEVAGMRGPWSPKSMADVTSKYAGAIANRTGTAISRTAGGSVGEFSNILTQMMTQIARSPMTEDLDATSALVSGLYAIRQAPITAQKSPVMSLEVAKGYTARLRSALNITNPEGAAGALHKTILDMTAALKGTEGSEYQYWAGEGAKHLEMFANARTRTGILSGKWATMARADDQALSEIFGIGADVVLGGAHGGRISMATETAAQAGTIAKGLLARGRAVADTATGKAARIFEKHGGVLALGVGIMAAAGIAMTRATPVATFGQRSGNKYRPEAHIAVPDTIPGEPVPGIMAPQGPPIRQHVSSRGVRRGVVAPLAYTSDVEVRMKATDWSRASETARRISMIPGSSESNITVNYRDKTRLRSLRTRDRIREMRS